MGEQAGLCATGPSLLKELAGLCATGPSLPKELGRTMRNRTLSPKEHPGIYHSHDPKEHPGIYHSQTLRYTLGGVYARHHATRVVYMPVTMLHGWYVHHLGYTRVVCTPPRLYPGVYTAPGTYPGVYTAPGTYPGGVSSP